MAEDAEYAKLRQERDMFLRELLATRKSLDEPTVLVAKHNDRLDEVVTMLRRREPQLKRAEREDRKLRRQLGLDPDPDPEPDAARRRSPTRTRETRTGRPRRARVRQRRGSPELVGSGAPA